MSQLSDSLVAVLADYLGPAAERFLQRQVEFHLEKKIGEISKTDIPRLSEVARAALSLITQDKTMVDECYTRMLNLSK